MKALNSIRCLVEIFYFNFSWTFKTTFILCNSLKHDFVWGELCLMSLCKMNRTTPKFHALLAPYEGCAWGEFTIAKFNLLSSHNLRTDTIDRTFRVLLVGPRVLPALLTTLKTLKVSYQKDNDISIGISAALRCSATKKLKIMYVRLWIM